MAAAAAAGADVPPGGEFVVAGADLSAVFGGRADIKAEEEVKYLGSRPLHCEPETDAAVATADQIKKASKTGVKASIIVSTTVAGIVSLKDGDVLQQAALEYTVLFFVHPKSKKMLVTVTKNARLGVAYCHVVTGSQTQIAALVELFKPVRERAKGAAERAAPSTMDANLAALEHYDDTVHGVFEGRYLGCVPVVQSDGADTVSAAYSQALKNLKKAREPGQESILIVTTDGLRVFEALTEDQMMVLDLLGVTYATVLPGDEGDEIIGLIDTDERLDQKNCYLWSCRESGMAAAAESSMSGAIEIVKKNTAAKADDPFFPDSFKKEAVPPALDAIQIDRETLTGVKVLGAGQFGRVYLAVQSFDADESKDIQRAVKLLRDGASAADKEEFTREAEIMTLLDHPNVVKIVGAAMVYRPWLVVLEMMQYGDLKKVMLACQSKNLKVTFLEILLFSEQIAAALEFCASKGYVHMDVAARNALLHTNNLVKLSDFGITRPVDKETNRFRLQGQLRMAVRWMAPETLGKHPILFSGILNLIFISASIQFSPSFIETVQKLTN